MRFLGKRKEMQMKKSTSNPKSKGVAVFSPCDVSTVHQSRCAVFQPTRRPINLTARIIETPWGKATIKGRLGQNHQDLLDACFAVAEKRITADDGRIFMQIDPYLLRKKLGCLPHSKIKDWLQELRSATVEIQAPARGIWVIGGIIEEAVISHKTIPKPTKPGHYLNDGERHYLRIIISRTWAGMMQQDLPTGYRGHLDSILALEAGISQAVARLMLCHASAARIGMDAALTATGASTRHDHRCRVVAALMRDAPALAKMGITVTPETVHITPHVPGESDLSLPTFPDTTPHVHGRTPHVPGEFRGAIGI